MMDLEAVAGAAAFHCAASVPAEDMTSQFPVHGAGSASQIQRFTILGDAEDFDDAVTEDLFERPRAEPGSGQN